MCLWFPQMCTFCGTLTFPNLFLLCKNSLCYRKDLNHHYLTPEQKLIYIDMDYPCHPNCDSNDCGLMIQNAYSNGHRAVCNSCYYDEMYCLDMEE